MATQLGREEDRALNRRPFVFRGHWGPKGEGWEGLAAPQHPFPTFSGGA